MTRQMFLKLSLMLLGLITVTVHALAQDDQELMGGRLDLCGSALSAVGAAVF